MKYPTKDKVWFLICSLSIITSTFIHECAHGLSCMINGYAVSTGFNRVGNAYKFPSDIDFRRGFSGGENLKDLGVAVTLLLAIIFTVISIRKKYKNSTLDQCIFAFALSNSILRLIPAVSVLLRIIFTGSGTEDEIMQGAALAKLLGWPFMTYTPAVFSAAVSSICLYFLYKNYRRNQKQNQPTPNPSWIWPAFTISFIVLNVLDQFIRINWIP